MKFSMQLFVALACLFLFGYQPIIAQPDYVKVTQGPIIKAKKKGTLDDIIGHVGNSYYTTSYRKKWLIEKYSNSMQLQTSKEIELPFDDKERSIERFMIWKDKIVLFSSYFDKKLKEKYLFVETINPNSLGTNHDMKRIDKFEVEKRKFQGDFSFTTSRNDKRLLEFANLPYEKNAPETYYFQVFDEKLNKLWSNDVTLPYTDDLFSVENIRVDDNGYVYVMGVKFQEGKERRASKRDGDPTYTYKLISYHYNDGKVTPKEYDIKLKDKFITDMQYAITDDGNIVVSGLYSKVGTYSIKGAFYLTVDAQSREIVKTSFKEFDFEFLTEHLSERKKKKAKKKEAKGKKSPELYQYDLQELILREDGGVVLIAEQFYIQVVTSSYTDANGHTHTTTTYYYHYNDIVVVNINPQGEIEWNVRIDKQQTSTNDGGFFSSYTSHVKDDKIYIIFNDNPKNMFQSNSIDPTNKPKTRSFIPYKESVIAIVEINSDGYMKKDILVKTEKGEVVSRPKVAEQLTDDETILFAQRKKEYQFIRLNFK